MADWLDHPNNDPPELVAERFGLSRQWATEHMGSHICVDGKRYVYSCLVSDPSLESVARSYMELSRRG